MWTSILLYPRAPISGHVQAHELVRGLAPQELERREQLEEQERETADYHEDRRDLQQLRDDLRPAAEKEARHRPVHPVPARRARARVGEDADRQQAPDAVEEVHGDRAHGIVDVDPLQQEGGQADDHPAISPIATAPTLLTNAQGK